MNHFMFRKEADERWFIWQVEMGWAMLVIGHGEITWRASCNIFEVSSLIKYSITFKAKYHEKNIFDGFCGRCADFLLCDFGQV